MKVRKSRVSMAVGAILSTAMLAPATVLGIAYGISEGELEPESGGDALLFPIYTTVDGASTSFSVTNLDDDEGGAVAVIKIRFREQEHSMDVLDFIAVLSPDDKFDFWVSQGENDERPVMSWNDNSCVIGPDGNSVMFPAPNTPFVTTNEQMQVGHLEVLGTRNIEDVCMRGDGSFYENSSSCGDDTNIGDWAIHGDDGKPANCPGLVDLLSDPNATYEINEVADDLEEHLIGRYVITAGDGGVEAGGNALEIEESDMDLYAQSSAPCIDFDGNPSTSPGMCTSYYAWDKLAWDHPHLGELSGDRLGNLQTLTGAYGVAGDWSNNPDNYVGVDWVLTFFSKYAYLDYIPKDDCEESGGSAKTWCLLYDTPAGTDGDSGVWTDESTTNTCLIDNSVEVWGTEEDKASGNVNVSPGQRDTLDLCSEVEVFTFAADDGAAPRDSLIQTNERRNVIGFKNLDAVRGWATMELAWNDHPGTMGGLIFTTRATDNPLYNNGSITEMSKPNTGD